MRRKLTTSAAVLACVVALTLILDGGATVDARSLETPTYDRNGGEIKVGMFVGIPCIITAITPSLNPATTSVACQTLPNVGGAEYDEGLPLIVYPAQILKR